MSAIEYLGQFRREFHIRNGRYPSPVEISNGLRLPIARRDTVGHAVEALKSKFGQRVYGRV